MEFSDRLGWVALIMAFVGIAITILWPTKRWIGWLSLCIAAVLGAAWSWFEFRPPLPAKHEIEATARIKPETPPPDLKGIKKDLDEINKRLSEHGRAPISASQMAVIKEVEQFLVGRDEYSLRETFGFPLMMDKNIRMNVLAISHYKKGTSFTREMMQENSIGSQMIEDSELAEGRIQRHGGGFLQTPMDGTNIYALMLPDQYTDGKKKLLNFESSPELPSVITKEIKGFDECVYKNADGLLHVLNSALKKDPSYFLRYDDVSSAEYFHQIDAMWLDHFIQLEPKANKIRDAIRKYLGVE